ncbi:MAG: hypothetical protein ICV62_03675 [Cyanobacteria bacterium Co-bin13]|nr:hypothetical protein [Cyanobacteria bacterium Co-bin13]
MEPQSPFNSIKRTLVVAGGAVFALAAWVATAEAQVSVFEDPLDTRPGAPGAVIPAPDIIPAPEDLRAPNAVVQAPSQSLTITLVNNTPEEIIYRVVDHTQERYLAGNESVDLADIPIPASLTFYTTDGRLLTADIVTAADADDQVQLEISGTTLLTENQSSMIVQDNGYIFLQ